MLHGFLTFSQVSLTELCSFWYGLKDLFTLLKLADKRVLNHQNWRHYKRYKGRGSARAVTGGSGANALRRVAVDGVWLRVEVWRDGMDYTLRFVNPLNTSLNSHLLPLFISYRSSDKISGKFILCDHVRNSHEHSILQTINITWRNLILNTEYLWRCTSDVFVKLEGSTIITVL